MSEIHKHMVTRYVAQMGSGRIDPSLLDAEFSVWTANSGDLSGPAFLSRLEHFTSVFATPPLCIKVTGLTAEGDRVAAEAESHGMLRNGVEYRNTYHFLFLFAGGRIRHFREYTDTKRVVDLIRPLMENPGR